MLAHPCQFAIAELAESLLSQLVEKASVELRSPSQAPLAAATAKPPSAGSLTKSPILEPDTVARKELHVNVGEVKQKRPRKESAAMPINSIKEKHSRPTVSVERMRELGSPRDKAHSLPGAGEKVKDMSGVRERVKEAGGVARMGKETTGSLGKPRSRAEKEKIQTISSKESAGKIRSKAQVKSSVSG